MNGCHIAIFPLMGKPHIYPFLGLCPELVRRGYRVTLVTDELHAKLVPPAGAEPIIVDKWSEIVLAVAGSTVDGWSANDPRWLELIGGVVYPWMLNSAALTVYQLDKFYKENRPDLIIYDLGAYAGRILAKRLHAPAIQYYYDFIYHNGRYGGYNSESIDRFSKLLDSFLWAYGFKEKNSFWHSEDLNLCPLPMEFQFDADLIDSRRFCFAGPFLDRPFIPMWKNRSGGKRIILISAISGSTDANYFNIIIDALSGSQHYVILSVGEHFPISKLKALPENFEINRYASHLEILPHTDLHLYSGGISGTLEGFYFGVPLIALPSYIGNYQIAKRVAELGFGLNLPLHAMTSEMIRENIEKVLQDDAFLGRVKQMQQVIRSSGGSVMAVDRIEEFLAGCAREPSFNVHPTS